MKFKKIWKKKIKCSIEKNNKSGEKDKLNRENKMAKKE